MKQSRRQAIGKHHVVVNDMAESWEHGPIVNPEQTVTLQQYGEVVSVCHSCTIQPGLAQLCTYVRKYSYQGQQSMAE